MEMAETAVKVLSKGARKVARRRASRAHWREESGKALWAYCNIRTNQVLYSLQPWLNNTHLKQLADAGANNNPPKLRKDLWRPLFAVQLPSTTDGQKQGQELFDQLREYRLLHETTWELPDEIKRPYSEKDIETLKTQLENRGGSKRETVYDVIKRRKKSMRQKMVMDQKANSIADLAQILMRMGERGAEISRQKQALSETEGEVTQAQIADLARQHKEGRVEKLQAQIANLAAQKTELQKKYRDMQSTVKERKAAREQAKKLNAEWTELRLDIDRMEWASKEVQSAKALAEKEHKQEMKNYQRLVAERERLPAAARAKSAESSDPSRQPSAETAPPPSNDSSQEQQQIQIPDPPLKPSLKPKAYLKHLHSFPPRLDVLSAVRVGREPPSVRMAKKLSPVINLIKAPIYTTENVTIKWANPLDAEFAAKWPDDIQHHWMGYLRHGHAVPGKLRGDGLDATGQQNPDQKLLASENDTAVSPEGEEEAKVVVQSTNRKGVREEVLSQLKNSIMADVQARFASRRKTDGFKVKSPAAKAGKTVVAGPSITPPEPSTATSAPRL